MRAEEIEQNILSLVLAMIRVSGVAVDCMEPLVLMAKLNRAREGRGVERISWMRTPLLEIRRRKTPEGTLWTLHSPDGVQLQEMLQESAAPSRTGICPPDRQTCSTEKRV